MDAIRDGFAVATLGEVGSRVSKNVRATRIAQEAGKPQRLRRDRQREREIPGIGFSAFYVKRLVYTRTKWKPTRSPKSDHQGS